MGSLRSTHTNSALVFWQEHRRRWIDAIGQDVKKVLLDFASLPMTASDNPAEWSVTLVEAGGGESTVAMATTAGGGLLITTDAADDDGVNMQMTGEAFKLESAKPLYFGIKFQASEATQSDFLVGLCITDTTLLGGMTDGAYFECLDAATGISFVSEKDSSEEQSDSLGTFADATDVILEFYWDGSKLEAFVNGTSKATHSTTLPDDEILTPSIQFLTGAASAETMNVDWLRVIQLRA